MEMIDNIEQLIYEIISERDASRYLEVKDAAKGLYRYYVESGRVGTEGLMESLLRIEEKCGQDCPWAGPTMDRLFDGVGIGNDIWLA